MPTDRMEVPTLAPLGFGTRARDLAAALVTGQIAGIAMLATMMLFSVAEGGSLLDPLRAIGSIGYGESGLRPGAGAILLGIVLHQLGFSAFWSLVFGFLAGGADRRNVFSVTALGFDDHFGSAVLGLLVGMGSNLIDVVVVMPAIAQGAEWTQYFLGLRSWCYHLVFGLVLAMYPLVRDQMFPRR